jgi:hypothetical protein
MAAQRTARKRVRALFRDSAVLFDLPEQATMEQLAALLAAIGKGHGAPLHVEVAIGAES